MKLRGSKTEQDHRDELLASHEFHFSLKAQSRLKKTLQQAGCTTNNAYVLHWTPDQSEDFYTVLVDGIFLVVVEIDRYEVAIEPIVKRHELTDYVKGLSRMQQVRLLVAQELANEKI